jgi:hypothetical protein
VDASGKPVGDAFAVAVPQEQVKEAYGGAAFATRWTFVERPVLTATDGTFTIAGLANQSYAVRAFRKGGGDVIVENVALGATIKLQMRSTASIAGAVHDVDKLTVSLMDDLSFERSELFVQTAGQFAVRDLPPGRYVVVFNAERGWKKLAVDLTDGEHKQLELDLLPLFTVTGKVVDLRSRAPLAGIKVSASSSGGADYEGYGGPSSVLTDSAGRFTLERIAPGRAEIVASGNGSYGSIEAVRTLTADAIVELALVKSRATDESGELGFSTKTLFKVPLEQRKIEVEEVDEDGPAANSGLVEGDIITAVDGIDVQGVNTGHFDMATDAPPGTKIALRLARGVTVKITLGKPAP